MLHKLSFHVEPAAQAVAGPAEPLNVGVHPVVDGRRLDPDGRYFFDIGLVLALRAHDAAPVDFFTCSCGVAGCIGIHEPSELRTTGDTVSWQIPTGKHGVDLDMGRPGEKPPLVQFTFDRLEYEQVLDDLVRRLEELSTSNGGRGVDICGGLRDNAGRRTSLRARIEAERQRAASFYGREAWRRRVFRDLLSLELEFSLPNGYIGSIPLENLAYALASTDHWRLDATAMARIENDIVPSFRTGSGAVTGLTDALTWPAFVEQAFRSDRCPAGLELGPWGSAPSWPAVTFALVGDARNSAP